MKGKNYAIPGTRRPKNHTIARHAGRSKPVVRRWTMKRFSIKRKGGWVHTSRRP